MTAFGRVCGSICEVKQGPALSVKTKKCLHPYHICLSQVSTVTGMLSSHIFVACQKCQQSQGSGGVAVAILVTVIVVELSYLCGVSKVSTVTRIRRVAVAILACERAESVNSSRNQAGRGRHPRNCHRC